MKKIIDWIKGLFHKKAQKDDGIQIEVFCAAVDDYNSSNDSNGSNGSNDNAESNNSGDIPIDVYYKDQYVGTTTNNGVVIIDLK